MKLEKKHWSYYLPHDVKIVESYWSNSFLEQVTETAILDLDNIDMYFKDEDAKLILRSMSDLYKEIEVNGETFTPAERIKKMYPVDTFSSTNNSAQWSYRIVQKLLEWHFDIYGLISEGLAININKLC
jgi:hypothetical protein